MFAEMAVSGDRDSQLIKAFENETRCKKFQLCADNYWKKRKNEFV